MTRNELHKGQRVEVRHLNGTEQGTVDWVSPATQPDRQVRVYFDDDTYTTLPAYRVRSI